MKAELLQQVESIPEFEEKPVFVNGVEQKNFKAIVEKGKTEAIAIVKKKYVLIQIRDALKQVVELLPDETTGSVSYWNGRGMAVCFPNPESDVGLRVLNSVDASTALRVEFLAKTREGHIYLPHEVNGKPLGAREIHIGEVKKRFLGEIQTLSQAVECWRSIVNKLSQEVATEEDLQAIQKKVGKRVAKRLGEIWAYRQKMTVWDLILEAVRAVASRKFKSAIHREERLRRLSMTILAYSL